MKNKFNVIFTSIIAGAMIVSGAALPAFAQTTGLSVGVNASASVSTTGGGHMGVGATALLKRIQKVTTNADLEITRRINALNALSTRINAMQKLSSDEKGTLSSTVQTQIAAMNTLQTQIAADAAAESTTSLKTDVQSITSSYRIFALVIPQGAIEAAVDRVMTIVSTMNDLSTKFSVRISAAQSAGNDVTAAQAALTDFNAKVSDANTQAQAANTEVAGLTPDNGNQTQMQANTAALKDARSKIKTAQQDLVAARADAETIIKAFASYKVGPTAVTASSSVSSSAQ